MKKITQEQFQKRVLENFGDRLDASGFVYSGYGNKSTVRCPKHGEYEVSAQNLLKGYGCVKCFHESQVGDYKDTLETFIEKARARHGDAYSYDKAVYAGAKKKLTITCPQHGDFTQAAWSHTNGQGCPDCGDIMIGLKCRLTHDEFVELAHSVHGDKYDLTNTKYVRMDDKITVVCKEHGEFYPLAKNFIYRKSGCPACGNMSVGIQSRKSPESYMERIFAVHGDRFTYGEITYKKKAAYIQVFCKEHGEFKQLLVSHLNGVGCVKCSKPVYDQGSFLKNAIAVHGDRYDYSKAKYSKAIEKVTIICKEHGEFEQTPSCHVSGEQGCPRCASTGPSKEQQAICDFINQFVPAELEVEFPDSRHRHDILVSSLNLAVEYHGAIWHSTAYKKDPLSDFKKHNIAKENGIRTIHIYDDEWLVKREIVERVLLSAIGKLDRMFARNTTVVSVSKDKACEFFNANHLQGAPRATLFIGLEKDTELVACMAFGMARSVRTNTDTQLWELQRYAATKTVVGGASRLLKAFLKMKICHTLISYSDERLFTGNMYAALGFTLEHVTKPDYCYVTTSVKNGRMHKSNFQRKNLPTKLENFDESLTEIQNCKANGFYQLFDCGKKKWSLSCA